MNPLISIIIPVYKVEKYLQQCVESIISQTFKNYEVLLIDDGSPDSSPVLCDRFAKKYPFISVIHKKNGGLSDARNVGIKNAKGEYLIFVDSDDYWEGEDSLQKLAETINSDKADVVLYGCKDYFVRENIIQVSRNGYDVEFLKTHDVNENIEYLFRHNLFPGAAWLLAVKKSLLLEHEIFFVKGIKAEDYDWLINLFIHIDTVSALDIPFYIYRKGRKDSITGTSDFRSLMSLYFIIDKWHQKLLNLKSPVSCLFLDYLSYIYILSLVIYVKLPQEEKKRAYLEIKKRRYVLNHSLKKSLKLAAVVNKILGIKAIVFLLDLKIKLL